MSGLPGRPVAVQLAFMSGFREACGAEMSKLCRDSREAYEVNVGGPDVAGLDGRVECSAC